MVSVAEKSGNNGDCNVTGTTTMSVLEWRLQRQSQNSVEKWRLKNNGECDNEGSVDGIEIVVVAAEQVTSMD